MTHRPPIARRAAAATAGCVLGGIVAAPSVLAHTGHPLTGAGDGFSHPLTGTDHLLAMVAVGVLAALTRDRRIAWATPLGFVAGMVAGGALGMLGVPLPASEVAIAVSVVVLGGLVAISTREAGWWLPGLAAAFGALHGHAHGAELPEDAAPLAYVAGFVLATAALHLAGTAVGRVLRELPLVRIAAGAAVAAVGVALLAGA